ARPVPGDVRRPPDLARRLRGAVEVSPAGGADGGRGTDEAKCRLIRLTACKREVQSWVGCFRGPPRPRFGIGTARAAKAWHTTLSFSAEFLSGWPHADRNRLDRLTPGTDIGSRLSGIRGWRGT